MLSFRRITTALILLICLFLHKCKTHLTYIEVKYQLKGTPSPPGSPWPLPQSWDKTSTLFSLNPDLFKLILSDTTGCDILKHAVDRCREHMFPYKHMSSSSDSNRTVLYHVFIDVNNTECGYPGPDMNEKYTIDIPANPFNDARITAETVWGVVRALETLSQLVFTENGGYVINATKITDFPRFRYRGILLDTSRHFLPLKVLLDNLDAMSYNKFNVFHWHIIDDQSFPFESKLFPNLTLLGAYSEQHVYTQDDVKRVIDAARLRGIRVIPEIDTPGHTQAFGKAFPDLLTTCYADGKPFTPVPDVHAAAEILNPINDRTYEFFKMFFQEIRDVFVDEYIHLGMDEVYYDCWLSNPEIQKFMQSKMFSNMSQVEEYYVERTLENVKEIGYKYQIWQDPTDNGVQVAPDAVVQIWKNKTEPQGQTWQEVAQQTVQKGYDVVISAPYYLNKIEYGPDWRQAYECDPQDFEGSEQDYAHVIGGEACMWGEFVDGTNALARLWPRASAVAERLWSDYMQANDTDDAMWRLDEHRCRMVGRGIPAQPILNGYCDRDWGVVTDGSSRMQISFSNIGLKMFLILTVTVYLMRV